MRGSWVLIVLLAVIVVVVIARGPMREWNERRAARRQERKRQWRKERDAAKAQHASDHSMNPAKAAARDGAPRWQKVAKASGSKCWLCGTRTYADDRRRDRSGREELGATFPVVDYVVRPDRGGSQELSNARIAHRHCASIRAARPDHVKFGRPPRTFGG